jgi:hypothetical protein
MNNIWWRVRPLRHASPAGASRMPPQIERALTPHTRNFNRKIKA